MAHSLDSAAAASQTVKGDMEMPEPACAVKDDENVGLRPPALKRPRLGSSPAPSPLPSSSALTAPTSSEQAVAQTLTVPLKHEDQSEEAEPGHAAATHIEVGAATGLKVMPSGPSTGAGAAPTSSPPTVGSDFDDLDWAWLDKGDELERTAPTSASKGKGRAGPGAKAKVMTPRPQSINASSSGPSSAAFATPARQVPKQVFFQTASHKKIGISDRALQDARRRLEQWDAEDHASEDAPRGPNGSTASTATNVRTAQSSSALDSTTASSNAGPSRDGVATPTPAFRRPLQSSNAPAQVMGTANFEGAPSEALLSPSKPNQVVRTAVNPSRPAQRRSTPASTRARPRFSTPFKKPGAPDALQRSSERSASPSVVASLDQNGSRSSPVIARGPPNALQGPPRPAHTPIFDLTQPQHPRLTLAESGIVPESVSAAQAQARGAPNEVIVILKHPDLARHYVFDDASLPNQSLGPAAALEMLRSAAGPSSAAHSNECLHLRWVQNHWALILWKLAALVRHRPEDVYRLWTWTEMCRQLKYRYEREINRAQRSAVKKIQEHDASASAPMVLCVRSILPGAPHWSQDIAEGSTNKSASAWQETAPYTLELTDGWYRVRAAVDKVLGRAIERKRIKAGVKLAIRGAKLHSGHDGTYVLDGLEKSGLSLTANSTSLARWDARLGFSQTDFAASLRSLTADGGSISCMDVILTKVHPRGYIDVNSGAGGGGALTTSNARSEAEEQDAAERWQTAYEDAQASVQAELETRAERWEEVRELLDEWAERLPPSVASTGSHADEDEACERLLTALMGDGSPRDILKAAANHSNPPLGTFIQAVRTKTLQRLEEERQDSLARAQDRLRELCPPRRTRSFQVVRFRDAVEEAGRRRSAKMERCRRSVQLTVWDAAELSESVELVEGGRYKVYNLQPIRRSSWRGADDAADIYLCTQRNTTWRKIG